MGGSWTAAEIARSTGLVAMPWGLLGTTQLDNPLLNGLYPVIGGHGVAGVSWVLSGLLLVAVTSAVRWASTPHPVVWPGLKTGFMTGVVALACASSWVDWTEPTGQTLQVRLVHSELPETEKYTPDAQRLALVQLQRLAEQGGADMTVFPELFLQQISRDIPATTRRAVVAGVLSNHGALVFGSPELETDDRGVPSRFNALVQIADDGTTHLYAKELLLPFSEYLPAHPFVSWAYPFLYRYPQADMTPGERHQTPFRVNGAALGVTICSELAYAGKSSRQALGSTLLVNASSDSWVPSTPYLAQAHLIARVRAAEAQKPMVRANNVGVSAFIDERGRVLASVDGASSIGVMAMSPRAGDTPHTRWAATLSELALDLFSDP